MGELVEFPLEDDGSLLIEVHPATPPGQPVTRALGDPNRIVVDVAHPR